MNWEELRSQVKQLIFQNGIPGAIIQTLKLLACILIVSIGCVIASMVFMVPGGILSGIFGDEASIVAFITAIFSTMAYLCEFLVMGLGYVGLANVMKNFVKTGNININDLFFPLKNDNKGLIIKTMAIWYIGILWRTFLCYVPGILYAFKTMFVPFLLTENPDMSSKDIINLSKEMTEGFKMEYFVQGILMILPWGILASILSCCTLFLSVMLFSLYSYSIMAAYYIIRLGTVDGSNNNDSY